MRGNLNMLLVLLLSLPAKAQFVDSFEDGSLKTQPTWIYNNGDFEIYNNRLRSANGHGGAIIYGISSERNFALDSEFRFEFELQANPSSSNYIDVFIAADTLVQLAQNGYFIRIGDLKDEISFYKLYQGVKYELISGKDGELNKTSNKYAVHLMRHSAGSWSLRYTNKSTNITDTAGTAIDTSISKSKFVGIKIIQNGTSIIGKHLFDNIYFGPIIRDTIAPYVEEVQVKFPNGLTVYFNEKMRDVTPQQFAVSGLGSPLTAVADNADPAIVHLTFPTALQKNTDYIFQNSNSFDLAGNKSLFKTIPFRTHYFDTALPNDIIITEIMSTPAPSLGKLPDLEYVEIKNTTAKYIRLKNCSLHDAGSFILLPDTILPPFAYAVISKNTTTSWTVDPPIWIRCSSFPSLNNDADLVALYNQKGQRIFELQYTENWHSEIWKRNGGWSLEMIDTSVYCISNGNWISNKTIGGTPGIQNSVCAPLDKLPLFRCIRAYMLNEQTVRLFFSENTDSASISPMQFQIMENTSNPSSIKNNNQNLHSIDLEFATPLEKNKVFTLALSHILSCYGSEIASQTIRFGWNDKAVSIGDVFINEILFDPKADGHDFAEIINTSDDIVDLNGIMLASRNEQGQIETAVRISETGYTLLPGEIAWCSAAPDKVILQYPEHCADNALSIESMPGMPNEQGHLALLDLQGNVIDAIEYSDDFHSPVISDPDGISLEKTIPNAPGNNRSYWTSAASTAQFATPGLQNSQFVPKQIFWKFALNEPYFTPNNDGNKDLLQMVYSMDKSGYVVNGKVFSESGAHVADPFVNCLLGSSGTLIWDGNSGGTSIRPGNYVLFLEGYNTSGQTIRHKLDFSVLQQP